jgi:hypothetical protein
LRLKLPPFELHGPWFGHLTTLPASDTPKLQHCPVVYSPSTHVVIDFVAVFGH